MKTVIAAATAVFLGVAGASGGPPTDTQVSAAVDRFQASTRSLDRGDAAAYARARREAAAGALEELSVSELSVSQFRTLHELDLFTLAGRREEALARLEELARGPAEENAWAALLWLQYVPSASLPPEPKDADAARLRAWREQKAKAEEARAMQRRALAAVVNHAGTKGIVRTGQTAAFFDALAYTLDRTVVSEFAPGILSLAAEVTPGFPADMVGSLVNLFDVLAREESLDARARESVRVRFADIVHRAVRAIDPADSARERERARLVRAAQFLDGAYARGELVGRLAPELHFTWTSATPTIASLSDLRGRVVVLDFWATWCGPCVASFPDVAKLAARYEGYPVVILGVTSPQGFHVRRPEGIRGKTERVETPDDPRAEYNLMPEFIRQTAMTWPVAFSSEDVFNPDYGVRGIPHVAIIDPAGKVRYRGLHPSSSVTPWEEKTARIDGLLREFKLPVPPADAGKSPGR